MRHACGAVLAGGGTSACGEDRVIGETVVLVDDVLHERVLLPPPIGKRNCARKRSPAFVIDGGDGLIWRSPADVLFVASNDHLDVPLADPSTFNVA